MAEWAEDASLPRIFVNEIGEWYMLIGWLILHALDSSAIYKIPGCTTALTCTVVAGTLAPALRSPRSAPQRLS